MPTKRHTGYCNLCWKKRKLQKPSKNTRLESTQWPICRRCDLTLAQLDALYTSALYTFRRAMKKLITSTPRPHHA